MLRASRPLLTQLIKSTTGITGLLVHPNPLPSLLQTYQSTLDVLKTLPSHAAYRQSAETLTQRKLEIVQGALGGGMKVEEMLGEGQIEQSLDIAEDELALAGNMLEWKPWEPLVEKPMLDQWEYFGQRPGQQ
ncbi:NADH2 dehydrogenase [Pterulicium gracile]|uniref:NADH2 dehydrogenase n=1 Tax=Pterulicium gracile TaxID=1884261 RepID=A0A5C3QAS1_9AGAR|nr:NADH2 dehydrogenase [Pterula gracilis]